MLTSAWRSYLELVAEVAPRTRAAVRPPSARVSTLDSLPTDRTSQLREWFELHDGTGWEHGELIPGHWLPGIDDAMAHTRMIHEIWSEVAEDETMFADDEQRPIDAGSVVGTWLSEYFLFADDGSGGGLFVDTRRGPLHGCVRQWDKVEADDDGGAGPVATNLAELVEAAAAAVRGGGPAARFHDLIPSVEGGVLQWTYEQ